MDFVSSFQLTNEIYISFKSNSHHIPNTINKGYSICLHQFTIHFSVLIYSFCYTSKINNSFTFHPYVSFTNSFFYNIIYIFLSRFAFCRHFLPLPLLSNKYSLYLSYFAPLSILICLTDFTPFLFGNDLTLILLISFTYIYYLSILTAYCYYPLVFLFYSPTQFLFPLNFTYFALSVK